MSTQPPRPGESDGSVESGAWGAHTTPRDGRQPADPGASLPTQDPGGVPTTAWRAGIGSDEADRAARTYWDAEADAYQAEHGAFLAGTEGGAADSARSEDRIGVRAEGPPGGRPGTGTGAGFVWGPEGLAEGALGMLGPIADLAGRRVLEVGCGAAQCSAWLAQRGVHAVGIDIAVNQLRHAVGPGGREPDGAREPGATRSSSGAGDAAPPQSGGWLRQEQPSATRFPEQGHGQVDAVASGRDADPVGGYADGPGRDADPLGHPQVVAATATALPFPDSTFDAAFSAYGAVQFVANLPRLLAEVRRVLVPGGRWAFSVTHPIRWAFPDEPGPEGLSVSGSYFDRTPYVERDDSGAAVYAEFHRTLGDYVSALTSAGFTVDRVVEPEWPDWNESTWGGWSPLRGMHLPGTLIVGCRAGGG